LYFCLMVAFGVWLFFSVANHAMPAGKRWITRLIALAIIAAGAYWLAQPKNADAYSTIVPGAWKTQRDQYLSEGKNVIVKFTENSCTNCKWLQKFVYDTEKFQNKLAETNTILIIADKSYGDPTVDEVMREFNQQGLPLSLVYPAKDRENPIPLRYKTSTSMEDALKALDEAAARK